MESESRHVKYYRENKEKRRAYAKKYNHNPDNRSRTNEKAKEYYAKNREIIISKQYKPPSLTRKVKFELIFTQENHPNSKIRLYGFCNKAKVIS